MSDRTPFDVLGVSPDAEPEVIEAAYRAMARKYHPDANPGVPVGELNRRMSELNWAKEELDRDREGWRQPPQQAAAPERTTSPRSGTVLTQVRGDWHSAFKPPRGPGLIHIAAIDSINRWFFEDVMSSKPIFIFLLLCPPGWILHLVRIWHVQAYVKPLRKWVATICAEREAVVVEQVTYLSGHPLLPIPEEGALFVRDADLHLELRSGAAVDLPLSAIGTPSFYSHEKRGVYITTELAGMFLTNEILHRTEYFVQFPFRDDKGYDNLMRLACGNLVGPEVLSNLIVSARYQNAPSRV